MKAINLQLYMEAWKIPDFNGVWTLTGSLEPTNDQLPPYGGAGMAQWWEHLPPTNVAGVRFPDLATFVGWVCSFSTLHRVVFSRYSSFPSPKKNQHLTWFVLIVNFSLQCPHLVLQH